LLRGVIFDIDGTLIDSNDAHANSWVETLAEAGYQVPFDVIWPMIGMGGDKLLPTAPGARELVERMNRDGLKLVVATSASGDELEALLDVAGVSDLMGPRESASGGRESKPDPDIVQAAVRASRIKPEDLIMLGDTPYDVQASIGAHVNLVALLSGGWTALELSGATAIYDDPADLLRWYDQSPLSVDALAD